jgi:hypothetical protein
MKCYHLGFYINRYAGWYKIESFEYPIDVVRWLMNPANSGKIDGNIDFLSFRID